MLVKSALCLSKESTNKRRKVCLLGSTGSIGTSTLKIIENNPDKFEVFALVAGSNENLLESQILKFKPAYAGLAQNPKTLNPANFSTTQLVTGQSAINDLASMPEIDIVITAISGNAGLSSTLSAVKAGKFIALANKESLVCAGSYITELAQKTGAVIVPVDSEHSALFQVIQGEKYSDIDNLIITASGGPFLHLAQSEFKNITVEQALKHPRWNMGPKVTLDSATLMNKALEVIEAHWLFGIASQKIKVLVHPQSIVHSLVEFKDGTQLAQLSETDMSGAIAYAINYPHGRLNSVMKKLNLADYEKLEFYNLNEDKFIAIRLAKQVLDYGGNAGIVLSVANEIALQRFMSGKLKFMDICGFVENALNSHCQTELPSIDGLLGYILELEEGLSTL